MTIEQHYIELCNKADELLAIYNPCEISNGICKRGYFCCDGCGHLVDNKCSIKSLLCKTWICEVASNSASKDLIDGLKSIYLEGLSHNMIVFRGGLGSTRNEKLSMAMVEMPWKETFLIPK